ncbi:class i glutamine amidotransferase [Trichoderma arundinaceum]|uniref:D-lactate dehydratase n=1 Tax=Trichoderma arundinaceum TaxID=490622 RepID=A0A395ND67_TRIAR|nr:class i glutamine amidotransferase [Trichoderma arundinaceum]
MSPPKFRVLMVLSSATQFTITGKPTGWYLPEFAHPYTVLSEIADITVVSPKGGHSQVDPGSVNNTASTDTISHSFLQREEIWSNTGKISDFVGKGKDFDVLCCPGGHAPLFDLAEDQNLKRLIREVYEAGKIVAAICHGVIVFKDVKLSNDQYLVADAPVTGFSNEEEDKVGLTDVCPVLVETELVRMGARFEKSEAVFKAHVTVAHGGHLITGQNPASAPEFAEAIKQSLLKVTHTS